MPPITISILDRTDSGKIDFEKEFGTRVSIAPRLGQENKLKGEVIIDKTSIEIFWDEGRTVMTDIFFPREFFTEIHLKGALNSQIVHAEVAELQ